MIFHDQGAKFLKNRQFQGRLRQLHLEQDPGHDKTLPLIRRLSSLSSTLTKLHGEVCVLKWKSDIHF